ncbi:MAG: NAD(P)H-hydrate dehydratase [Chloroflexota bacterium]
MKLVTTEQMRHLEQDARARGLPYDTMMERAGRAVAQAIVERWPPGNQRVLALVGPGHNGGDGLVAARHLRRWGYAVTVYVWRRALGDDPHLARALALGIPVVRAAEDPGWGRLACLAGECHILVDALLGTGATGPLRGDLPGLLGAVQAALERRRAATGAPAPLQAILPAQPPSQRPTGPRVVAVDLPSGLDADSGALAEGALAADLTVTFAYPKRGHVLLSGAASVGELLVADIGLGASEFDAPDLASPDEVAALLPARPAHGHKGTFGRALVIAGSANYVGAACLAAVAAYRVGAGLVTLAAAGAIYPMVASRVTEATFLVLPSDLGALVPEALPRLTERIGGYEAALLGPGLGTEKATGELVWGFLGGAAPAKVALGFGRPEAEEPAPARSALPPLVIDADGLNLLARRDGWWRALPAACVLTPHPGEMARLAGCDVAAVERDRLGMAQRMARAWGCTVVLKGAYTVIASAGGQTTVLPFANPALATAGTGDVLAGAIVGLLAQGLAPHAAAVAGAYLHGLAGELLRAELGASGMVASDLLPALPRAMQRLRL